MHVHRSNAEESYYLASNADVNSTAAKPSTPDRGLFLNIYGSMVVGLILLCLFCIELFYGMTIVASRSLHDSMLSTLMRAPMYFFDNNSIGENSRILNYNIVLFKHVNSSHERTCKGILFMERNFLHQTIMFVIVNVPLVILARC